VATNCKQRCHRQAHLTNDTERFSLVAVRISTGRRHQIRTHLASSGHPVVCDGKYGGERYRKDVTWCPRNFLHRYRLAWDGVNGQLEVNTTLPRELKEALGHLVPKGGPGVCRTSEVQLQWWLADEWLDGDWAKLPSLEAEEAN